MPSRDLFSAAFDPLVLLSEIPIGVVLCQRDGRILATNPALSGLIGYSAAEIESLGWRRLLHPDDADDDAEMIGRLERGEVEEYDAARRLLSKDGDWLNIRVRFCQPDAGAPHLLLGFVVDDAEIDQPESLQVSGLKRQATEFAMRHWRALVVNTLFLLGLGQAVMTDYQTLRKDVEINRQRNDALQQRLEQLQQQLDRLQASSK